MKNFTMPSNPAEAGLAELWARTVPALSPGWRRRFVTVTHNLMVESMWELENIDAERVANPIEYLQLRRRVGGAPWSACLVVRDRRRGGENANAGLVFEKFLGYAKGLQDWQSGGHEWHAKACGTNGAWPGSTSPAAPR